VDVLEGSTGFGEMPGCRLPLLPRREHPGARVTGHGAPGRASEPSGDLLELSRLAVGDLHASDGNPRPNGLGQEERIAGETVAVPSRGFLADDDQFRPRQKRLNEDFERSLAGTGHDKVIDALLGHRTVLQVRADTQQARLAVGQGPNLLVKGCDLRPELVDPLVESGEKTLAVAPEAGTDRLRFAIHKRITNQEVLEKIDMVFERGVENLKLYLMVGLPGEREEDVEGIVGLVEQIRDIMLDHGRRRGRVGRVIPSINPFIPKPGTPFQWCPMASQKELHRKMRYLQKEMGRMPNVEIRCKSPRQERLQALLSLGDRRLAPAMVMMARGEADLSQALTRHGLNLDDYVHRARSLDEILPWDHIDNGMKIELLESQYEKALAADALVTR